MRFLILFLLSTTLSYAGLDLASIQGRYKADCKVRGENWQHDIEVVYEQEEHKLGLLVYREGEFSHVYYSFEGILKLGRILMPKRPPNPPHSFFPTSFLSKRSILE